MYTSSIPWCRLQSGILYSLDFFSWCTMWVWSVIKYLLLNVVTSNVDSVDLMTVTPVTMSVWAVRV